MARKRIAIGSFGHEANTFSPHITTMADFRSRWYVSGDALLDGLRGTNSCEAGAASVLEGCDACEIVPLMGARALSSAALEADAFHEIRDALLARDRRGHPGLRLDHEGHQPLRAGIRGFHLQIRHRPGDPLPVGGGPRRGTLHPQHQQALDGHRAGLGRRARDLQAGLYPPGAPLPAGHGHHAAGQLHRPPLRGL